MKDRRHHNNKGFRQIKRGKTRLLIKKLEKELVKSPDLKRQVKEEKES